MKVLTVVGARPQFIKASPVSRAISKHEEIEEIIIHTGQHFDVNMSDVFFQEMGIPKPQYQLKIGSLTHGAMTGRMLEEIEKVILYEKPDWVLVYGDTNSTLAAALAASKLHIPIAHVEAGLRSKNMLMPEEQNRIIVDRLSSLLFCPTKLACDNLIAESYDTHNCNIVEIGDVMFDAAQYYKNRSIRPRNLCSSIVDNFILATVHRAENTSNQERLKSIIYTLNQINAHIPVIMPLHPRTRDAIKKNDIHVEFKTIEPISYLEMIYLLQKCKLVATDSGGLQKEAYFFKKHSVVLRDETEWQELIDIKANIIVGASNKKIHDSIEHFLSSKNNNEIFDLKLYGDGNSANLIVNTLIDTHKKNQLCQKLR